MTILQNPIIPIVVRFSMRECSLRAENRRTFESIRPDRLPYVEMRSKRRMLMKENDSRPWDIKELFEGDPLAATVK